MKRDMDIVREILLFAESVDPSARESPLLSLPGHDGYVLCEHARLLEEAGYVLISVTMGKPPPVRVQRLTWMGHDLLDSIRDDSVWAAVKKRLTVVGGAVSVELLKRLATDVAKAKLGLGEG